MNNDPTRISSPAHFRLWNPLTWGSWGERRAARKVIADLMASGCTRLAAEVVTLHGMEAEYPVLIAQYDREQAQLYA
jgi:hypothetical protein